MAWGFRLEGVSLSFASPKESKQRKGDPRVGAPSGFLPLLGGPGGWLNSPAAQTTPADGPRPACVAQRLSWGPQRHPRSSVLPQKSDFHGQPEKTPKIEISHPGTQAQIRIVSPGPLRGAEQRRKAGGLRRGLFEGRSPEFRSRPAFRVAQGTSAAGTDPGSPSSLATFFLAKQEESTPANKAEPQVN